MNNGIYQQAPIPENSLEALKELPGLLIQAHISPVAAHWAIAEIHRLTIDNAGLQASNDMLKAIIDEKNEELRR